MHSVNMDQRSPMSALKRVRFTLVELMVGMTILSILMLMMFNFLISTQRTLDWSDSMWKIYDNSRVAFDLLERDLQSGVVSETTGEEISLYVADPDPTDKTKDRHLVFVSSTEPPEATVCGTLTTPTSKLCEITYKHHTDTSTPTADIPAFQLHRQIISDVDPYNWNFLGSPANWYDNSNLHDNCTPGDTSDDYLVFDHQKVIGGVQSFAISYIDEDENEIAAGTEVQQMPVRVVMTLELFDETLDDAPQEVRDQTLRSFTKIFYLSHLDD